MNYMKNTIKLFCFSLITPLLLVGCATGNVGRSEKSEKAERVRENRICKGKIGKQQTQEVLLNLAKGDPSGFACNASHHYAQALAKTYAALGRAEDEKKAIRFVESLENGTGDPSGIKMLAATDASTEQKAQEQKDLASSEFKERKLLIIEATNQRNEAIKNSAAGVGAFLIGVKQIKAGLDSGDSFAKLAAVAKTIEMAQVVAVLPAIADTHDRFNSNMAHLDMILNVQKQDASGLRKSKPD
jgi:hypothetical protein